MKSLIKRLITAYLITFAVFNLGGFSSSDILLGAVFAGCIFALGRMSAGSAGDEPSSGIIASFDKKTVIRVIIVSALFTIGYYIYAGAGMGGGMSNPLFAGVYTLLTLAGIFLLFFLVTGIILNYAARHQSLLRMTDEGPCCFSMRRWLIGAGLIMLCFMPLFVMNFPASMTVDSYDQLGQAMGIYPYSDHHPWAHTMLIKLFYSIGKAVTGDTYGGIACFIIFQMIIMALSVAYAAESLREAGLPRATGWAVILGYVIYPYHTAYAITMWKDVIFSATVLIMTVTLYRMFLCDDRAAATDTPGEGAQDTPGDAAPIHLRDRILFTVSGLAMSLLRHNGFYAFIAICVIIIVREYIINRHRETRAGLYTAITCICTIIAVMLFNGPVERAFGVEKVDFAHNIPIPLQQVARVVAYNGDISPEDMQMIERINVSSYLYTHYEPGGADNVMQWVVFGDSAYLESHKMQYLGLWIRLGLRNPVAYLEAYIDQTRGYYTTMMPEQTEVYGMLPNEDGLWTQPLAGSRIRIKYNEICSKLGSILPIYGIMYSPGACLQQLILGAAILMEKRRRVLITYLPSVILILTVLVATPLCADLRYAYPMMLCMPFLISVTLCTRERV